MIPLLARGIVSVLPVLPLRQGPGDEAQWTFDVFPYYWSASVSGSMTLDGQEIDIGGGGSGGFSSDVGLSGFLGDFEAHRGPWSFAVAPIFIHITATGTETGGFDAAISIDAQIHEAFIAHDLSRTWEWLAGARYYELGTGVDLSVGGVPTGSQSSDHDWVDPIVGVRYHDDFGRHWSARARADIGGFGLGSDLAWDLSALLGYRFGGSCSAQLGYRVLSIDYSSGSGIDRQAYDLTLSGPILGLGFTF